MPSRLKTFEDIEKEIKARPKLNSLTLLRPTVRHGSAGWGVWCKCRCGRELEILKRYLTGSNAVKSCGCHINRPREGMLPVDEQGNLIARATNAHMAPTNLSARGRANAAVKAHIKATQFQTLARIYDQIRDDPKLCIAWRSFEKFASWARFNGFDKSRMLVRIKPDGQWHPLNCKWKDNPNWRIPKHDDQKKQPVRA